jgi:hypothetical protein
MGRDFEPVPAAIRVENLVCVNSQVSEGIDGDEHMANVGVDLAVLEALLQVVVDGLVGDLAQQRQIRDSDLFLLGDFKGGLLDLRLRIAAVISAPPSEDGCFGGAR